jgi:hypothetical protein
MSAVTNNKESVMESDSPPVVGREFLVPTRRSGASLLDRWVESDPKQAIERVETMVKMLEQLRIASIRATYPTDWIIHTTRTQDGEITKQVGYLQDSGAERAGKVWGIEVGNPAIEREDFPDGTYSYHMIAEAWSKVTGERLDYVEGSRWSGDTFFTRQVKTEGDKIDPTDVRKSSYANLHGRAVRALGGMNGVPLDTLRQAGLDVAKVVHVSYDKGARGGESAGASVGSVEVVVGFGNSKGAKPADLVEKDLDWYIKAYGENIADPAKARFAKANQRVLDALTAEKTRRAQAVTHEAETGTKAGRGQKLGDLHTRLRDAAKGQGAKQAKILRLMTKDLFGAEITAMSDLSEEQLDRMNAVPDDVLAGLVALIDGGKV